MLGRAGSLISGLIMARLLIPEDFGVYTVGAVALTLMAYINDLGIEALVVRWPGAVDEVAPTATTIIAIVSTSLFGVMVVGANWFATLLGSPQGAGVVRLMAVALLINGVFTINVAQVDRAFLQRARTKAEACSLVANIGIGVGLAATGFGAYSLAWGQIVGNLIVSVGLYRASPKHFRPGFDRAIAGELIRLGVPLAASGLFAAATLNIDYLIIGHQLGPVELGVYVLAFNLASWPVTTFTLAVGRVSLAGFARLQHDMHGLEQAFTRSIRSAVAVSAPICALLVGLALPLVRTLYGTKWHAAGVPLAYLAALGIVRVVAALTTDLMVAAGWTTGIFAVRGLWLIGLAIALPIGTARGGLPGVGIAQVAVGLVVVIPTLVMALRRRNFGVGAIGRAVLLPVTAAVVMAVVSFATSRAPVPDLARLALGGLSGLGVYLLATRRVWGTAFRFR